MNSNLQKKLFRFEAPPSEAVWEKITAALDNEASFSQRLYAYEETPPKSVWPAVEAALSQPRAKVVPFFARNKRPLLYVAAASVIAVMLTVATLNQQQVQVPNVAERVTQPQPSPPITQNQPSSTPQTATDEQPYVASSLGRRKGGSSVVRRTLAYIMPRTILPGFALRKNFIPQQVSANTLFDQASVDNFMVYSDGEGTVMRLPKKLFSLVCCQDGDGSCKVRLQRLRQTLSANVAPIDFGGMIDMLRQLQ